MPSFSENVLNSNRNSKNFLKKESFFKNSSFKRSYSNFDLDPKSFQNRMINYYADTLDKLNARELMELFNINSNHIEKEKNKNSLDLLANLPNNYFIPIVPLNNTNPYKAINNRICKINLIKIRC